MKKLATLLVAGLCACGGGDEASAPGAAPALNDDAQQPFLVNNCATPLPAPNPPPSVLWQLDPLGPMVDVTCEWQRYQPAEAFCVKIDGALFTPGGAGSLTDGADPACALSGFAPEDTGLLRVAIDIPILCPGCRRYFIDFARMPADNPGAQQFSAHGHAYYRINAINPTYTIEPVSHSPNTKNFYNDKLVTPPGTPIELVVGAIDTYDMAYVTDTARFIHNAIQGPHYIGPWYVNRDGERIRGIYLDVNAGDATSLGSPNLDRLHYLTGYNSGQGLCNPSPDFTDADLLYGGCVDRIGGSRDAYDPFR